MINFDDVTKRSLKEYNLNWQTPHHPHRSLIIVRSG